MVGVVAHQRRHVKRRASGPSGRDRADSGERTLVSSAVPNPANWRIVHNRPRYIERIHPRVNGYCPGKPINCEPASRSCLGVQRPDLLTAQRGERHVRAQASPHKTASHSSYVLGTVALTSAQCMRSSFVQWTCTPGPIREHSCQWILGFGNTEQGTRRARPSVISDPEPRFACRALRRAFAGWAWPHFEHGALEDAIEAGRVQPAGRLARLRGRRAAARELDGRAGLQLAGLRRARSTFLSNLPTLVFGTLDEGPALGQPPPGDLTRQELAQLVRRRPSRPGAARRTRAAARPTARRARAIDRRLEDRGVRHQRALELDRARSTRRRT